MKKKINLKEKFKESKAAMEAKREERKAVREAKKADKPEKKKIDIKETLHKPVEGIIFCKTFMEIMIVSK